MRKILLTACLIACSLMAEAKDWTQYVNPLMGTQSSFELSTGNTYPAIARPWGMNFWTPQTGKMGIHVYSQQNQGIQANPPTQPMDQ